MSEKSEVRGKSWRREREERGKRQAVQLEASLTSAESSKTSEDIPKSHVADCSKDNSGNHLENEAVSSQIQNSPENVEEKTVETEESSETLEENIQEQKRDLEQYINEISEKLRLRGVLRHVNATADNYRPEESFFSKLDSSLKKNTAFIKRLRNLTEAQRDSLVKDMDGLNLTKYISEAASAIVDAKLKMSDVGAAVQICSLLHQRYADFSPQLLEHWQKVLALRRDEKIVNPSKLRVDLRFYAELVSSGLFPLREGLPLLGNLLTVLTTSDREEHSNLGIVLSFCRHCGEDYAGLTPRRFRLLHDRFGGILPKSEFLPPDRQKGLRNLLKEYFKSLCRHLTRDYKALQNMEKQNYRILLTKGELSPDRKEKFENAQAAFQKLLGNTEQFSDIVDDELPELPKDENLAQDSETTSLEAHNRFKDRDTTEGSAWEDDDTRSFYENLPDLKAFIPGILFKESAQPASPTEVPLEEGENQSLIKGESDLPSPSSPTDLQMEKLELEESSEPPADDLTEELMLQQEMDETEEETATTGTANRVLLDGFLNSLLNCVNREIIDQAAVDFCMNLNTRPNRKKLVRALFLVPRTRLDLLPFFGRFVATLSPCMPDVASELVAMLKQDFKYHLKKKDQVNIETKVKAVRFIGELVKFNVFPKAEALYCLKLLLTDFIHHHVEMACNLLETCGRFLFQAPESHQRIKVLLEQMMRKKAVLSIDSRYTTMIENAFYYCNPPESAPTVRAERPPMHQYIRKLLYQDLTKANGDKGSEKTSMRVLRQVRKLDWEDPEQAAYITKRLTAVWNVKYQNIRCLANLLAGLVAYQESVGSQVVDGVLEDIRFGLEVNLTKYNQRRVSMIRYLGELYNYRMVESTVIFRVLYMLIMFGISYDEGTPSELDPPENLFRLRLVCVLLDTCGQYFNSGSSKKKLDYFLTFFQRYYWIKRSSPIFTEAFPFPIYVQYMVVDTIASLRPKLKLFESLEEAEEATAAAIEELKPKYAEVVPGILGNDEQGTPTSSPPKDGSLGAIPEEDDEECGDEEVDDEEDETTDEGTEVDTDGYSGSQSQPFEEEDENEESLSPCGQAADESRPVVRSAEDEDFMAAFDKMLSESILHRNQESVKPQVDIVIPMNIKGAKKKMAASIFECREVEKPIVNFVLMTRKGNKQQFKNLAVPVTSELAQNLKDREEAERAEKQHVKLLTLNINERQEEEDYQEMLASLQRPAMVSLNRDRRHKYQHPKGAPDADLIFGSK